MADAEQAGKVPLFTSLPPSMIRLDKSGRDIGAEYQLACIKSWIDAGFRPITVNGPDEQPPFPDLVEVMRTTRTAKELHGKPVVFIDDLFEIARRVTPGPVMIVNADILLRPQFDLAALVANLPESEALIARRIDIETLQSAEGQEYTGVDLVAIHSARLGLLPRSDFAFGLPWWDYFLPIGLDLKGVNVSQLSNPAAYHLLHEQKWDWESWKTLGAHYADHVVQILGPERSDWPHKALAINVCQQWRTTRNWSKAVNFVGSINAHAGRRGEKFFIRRLRKSLRSMAHDCADIITNDYAPQRPNNPGRGALPL